MEACLSYTVAMGMVACQDMGACGITCAAFEMAAAGGVGIEIDPHYCDVIVRRFVAFAGQGAVDPEMATRYRVQETEVCDGA